eukprot:UN02151
MEIIMDETTLLQKTHFDCIVLAINSPQSTPILL